EGHRGGGILERNGRWRAVAADREHIDGAVGLGRYDQVLTVRREADLRRRAQEERRAGVGQAQRAGRSSDWLQPSTFDPIPGDESGAARVEHVDQVAVHGDAGREWAA